MNFIYLNGKLLGRKFQIFSLLVHSPIFLIYSPESVKTRNDVFYLLPERSCVPDSPVWYSTMALGKEPLMKMLHRVKMVKEINIALLTC